MGTFESKINFKYKMKYLLPLLVVILLFSSCNSKEKNKNATIEILDQFSELQTLIDAEGDGLVVLNFWSIHCPPCIKELPYFNKLESDYENKNVKILLINLDDEAKLNSRIYPFVKNQGVQPEILLLQDQNYTKWTEQVDESWYGALPATLIVKGEKRKFRFGSYEAYEDLKFDVEDILNKQ